MNKYVPKILVAGDIEEFKSMIGNRPANIVGNVYFFGEVDGQSFSLIKTQTILLNGEIVSLDILKNMVTAFEFDYIIFNDYSDFRAHAIFLANNVIKSSQILMIDTFLYHTNKCFYSFYNELNLYNVLDKENINSLLDFDSFLINGKIYSKPKNSQDIRIDVLCNEKQLSYPFFENVYDKIYHSITDCCLRHYDAVLFTAEIDPENLLLKINETFQMADKFIVFIRFNSELNKIFKREEIKKFFDKIRYFNGINGRWYVFNKRNSENLKIYVVTHKKLSFEKLPEGYAAIHAGRAISEELGYQGDNSGQSISELNPYLNEMTAIYWIWKNISTDYVGIAHYRRFFTLDDSKDFSEEKILTAEQAKSLLQKYDIIVAKEEYHIYNLYSFLIRDNGVKLSMLALQLTKNMIERYQPDYLDVFDYAAKNGVIYKCNMMITRKYVFDSYCQWLFSFLLEAEKEFKKLVPMDKLSTLQKRIFGFISERMLTVWLIKNRLRVKELVIMENK